MTRASSLEGIYEWMSGYESLYIAIATMTVRRGVRRMHRSFTHLTSDSCIKIRSNDVLVCYTVSN